ncbi:hypothetical protein C4D60_Mb09t09770 [Musa balbisiana]|uniref:Uncharacterized protein n=1 Tax=Musa balbisiana TaxID=52838 RepID=A0A4S8IF84_MUSBA|nr:hypothetical protein C4D60_Mb09t09770 [Musa balbisiana]
MPRSGPNEKGLSSTLKTPPAPCSAPPIVEAFDLSRRRRSLTEYRRGPSTSVSGDLKDDPFVVDSVETFGDERVGLISNLAHVCLDFVFRVAIFGLGFSSGRRWSGSDGARRREGGVLTGVVPAMLFQMKIQPVDASGSVAFAPRSDPGKPAAKSRLKRLFERQFPSVLRNPAAEKVAGAGDGKEKERDDGGGDVEPSSVCLDTMVFSFTEEGHHDKPPRGRCNCFNANFDDSSDDDFDARDGDAPGSAAAPGDAAEAIKGLVLCASMAERNLLADASKILEKAKNSKNKGDWRRMVADGLRSLGYDVAVCRSRWDQSPSFPAGIVALSLDL